MYSFKIPHFLKWVVVWVVPMLGDDIDFIPLGKLLVEIELCQRAQVLLKDSIVFRKCHMTFYKTQGFTPWHLFYYLCSLPQFSFNTHVFSNGREWTSHHALVTAPTWTQLKINVVCKEETFPKHANKSYQIPTQIALFISYANYVTCMRAVTAPRDSPSCSYETARVSIYVICDYELKCCLYLCSITCEM